MNPAVQVRRGKASGSRRFGAHMSIAGGCDRAVWAAHAVGFETVQLFTKNNNRWNAPPLSDEHAEAFRSALEPDRHQWPGRPHFLPDQPGQPGRRTLEEVDRGDGRGNRALPSAGDRRPGRPSRRPHGSGRGGGAAADRAGARRDPSPDRGAGRPDRPGDDRRAGDLPGPSIRAPPGDPRPRAAVPSGWAYASTPATFSRRAIPWIRPRSTMRRSTQLDRSVGLDRVRVWHLNDSSRELRQPRRSPRRDRGRAAWDWSRSGTWSTISVPRFADDPGDAQGDRGRRGSRRPQPENLRQLVRPATSCRITGRSCSARFPSTARIFDASAIRSRARGRGRDC